MFEWTIALRYLIPKRNALSVSIISILSVIVIALVVWLTLVFFSTLESIEKRWTDKMIALTAPIRATPTPLYYKTYYWEIDSQSSASHYTHKTLEEKMHSSSKDPYNPDFDSELPEFFPEPLYDKNNELLDIVKRAFSAIELVKKTFPEITTSIFETAFSLVKIESEDPFGILQEVSLDAYLVNFDPSNKLLKEALLPIDKDDINNLIKTYHPRDDSFWNRLLDRISIEAFITPASGWRLPSFQMNELAGLVAYPFFFNDTIVSVTIPAVVDNEHIQGKLLQKEHTLYWQDQNTKEEFPIDMEQILISGGALLQNLGFSRHSETFSVSMKLQNKTFLKEVSPEGLLVHQFLLKQGPFTTAPLWVEYVENMTLPEDPSFGNAIILPKAFKEAHVHLFDKGFSSYPVQSTMGKKNSELPLFVAGFYDPGIIPIGGKVLLVSKEVIHTIQSGTGQNLAQLPTGFNIRFSQLNKSNSIKKALVEAFNEEGIAPFWSIEAYNEFSFTKELLQQMKSDKNLFSLISSIIIIVACVNIISMLLILVHDKKKEIAILRALGASKKSVVFIFALCGSIMGAMGSCLGIIAALITLKNLPLFLHFLGTLQGHDVLSTAFYGDLYAVEISPSALLFVLCATSLASLFAGLFPAIQAGTLNTSEALKSDE